MGDSSSSSFDPTPSNGFEPAAAPGDAAAREQAAARALAPDPNAAGTGEPEGVPISFTGDARGYFRIWIVNTFLTLLTLGVYAAWAKVRKKRYFYGHTQLLGHAFDYTARPNGLLMGNLLIAALFLGYSFFGEVYLQVRFAALGIATLVLPWLIVKALAFNARNSVHRGLRLHYRGRYGAGFLVYLIMPVMCVLSLGLFYPLFALERKKLAINFLRFGDCSFSFEGHARPVYGIYLRAALMVLPGLFCYGLVISLTTGDAASRPWFIYTNVLISFAIVSIARMYVQAKMFNYTWNNVAADAHRFRADMRTRRLIGIQLANTFAMVFTLGLALPWAQIRLARYKLSCLTFVPAGPLDDIEAFGQSGGSALSESAADFFGLDIGL